MDELLRGSGFGGEHHVLFDEMDLNVQAVDCDPILKISVKPVRFLDQNDPATRSAAQKRDHLAEAGSTAPLRCLHVGEFLGDVDRVLDCVLAQ